MQKIVYSLRIRKIMAGYMTIFFKCHYIVSWARINCISSMFYFFIFDIQLILARTATKIKYEFDILTRMTAVLVTQRTSLYENHMIINWKAK